MSQERANVRRERSGEGQAVCALHITNVSGTDSSRLEHAVRSEPHINPVRVKWEETRVESLCWPLVQLLIRPETESSTHCSNLHGLRTIVLCAVLYTWYDVLPLSLRPRVHTRVVHRH